MKISCTPVILMVIFSTFISNAQWIDVSSNISTQCLTSFNNNLYLGGGCYFSSNNGNSWTDLGLNVNNATFCLCANNNSIFAGTEYAGMYRTTNFGITWTPTNNGLFPDYIYSVVFAGNYIFAGLGTRGVYVSTNNGNSWLASNNGLTNLNIKNLVVSGNNIYAGTAGGIFLSTNNGDSWSLLYSYGLLRLNINDNVLIAGGYNSVIYSTNNGINWTVSYLPSNDLVKGVASNGNNLFAGTFRENGLILKIYYSSNFGQSWLDITGNAHGGDLFFLYTFNNFLFCGANFLWRRSISEITGIQSTNNKIPEKFTLYQNYPNPFNPSTKISYDLPKDGFVRLSVFDALGREIKTLVHERQNAGSYKIEFDGSGVPSGIYFYKLLVTGGTSNFSETKKMVLIK